MKVLWKKKKLQFTFDYFQIFPSTDFCSSRSKNILSRVYAAWKPSQNENQQVHKTVPEQNFRLMSINSYNYCQQGPSQYSPNNSSTFFFSFSLSSSVNCRWNLNLASVGSYWYILKSTCQKFTEAHCRASTKLLQLPSLLCPSQTIWDLFRGIWMVILNVSKKQLLNSTYK